MDYSALTTTVRKLNESIESAIQIDNHKSLVNDEEWIWNMVTLGKVTNFFEELLSDFDNYISTQGTDR